MQQKKIDQILASIKAPIEHPLFFPRVFALAAKELRVERGLTTDYASHIVTEEYEELSRHLDRSQIQESCSVRNVLRTRRLAQLLIDSKGDLHLEMLPLVISYLQKHLYSLGPNRQYDAKRQEHILHVLQLLNTNKDLVRLLKKFDRPLSNKWAEDLIRHTLQLPPGTTITDAHTRQAALSAWLCTLRQNVGSCFATAPAEIVHDEQPEQFLQDLLDLLSMGRLKRTFGGIEYSVPLSSSWGSGDLKKPLFIQFSSQGISPEIWYSPGLIGAFEAIGFLNPEEKIKQKVMQMEGWIRPLIQQRSHPYPYCLFTAEEIIRILLLQTLGLTEQQLKDYENRPRALLQTQLVMHVPAMGKSTGGLGERCANFYALFDNAKNVFKGYADNALLKSWEFTLASFSETKYEFTGWNLYASLGLGTNEPHGIGQCIYQTINQRLEQVNRLLQETQYEYEMAFAQVKTIESKMRHVSSEKEAQWLKIEYQSRKSEFYLLEEQREEARAESAALVNLYDTLYKLYVELFKDYFQEVYDADMQEVTANRFDDSPAGFRLLYKHGRSNTAQWTLIQNHHDFIDALSSFFVATEPQIAHALEGEGINKDLSNVVTAIINHIKTKEFLESAFHRMAAAHHTPAIKNPLEHLEKIEKKPWAYTSGGTMNTLVSCYYRLTDKPKEADKWVENEMELLVFLVDTIKSIPLPLFKSYLAGKRSSMLMQSPTHAFLLKPMRSPFKDAWSAEDNTFSYTYLRDRFVRPAEVFVERIFLHDEMIQHLIHQIAEKIPENFRPRFKSVFQGLHGPLNPINFRERVVDRLVNDRGLRYGQGTLISVDTIDSFLYSQLPLFPIEQLKDRVSKILTLLPMLTASKKDQILYLFDRIPQGRGRQRYMGAQELQDICKGLLCLSEASTTTPYDYHLHISHAAQQMGFAMPAPLIFADSNWVKDEFGFVVNPGTGKLEFWRVDYTGSIGYPIPSWKQWLNGSRSDLKWGVYVKPIEYGQG